MREERLGFPEGTRGASAVLGMGEQEIWVSSEHFGVIQGLIEKEIGGKDIYLGECLSVLNIIPETG